MSQCAYEYCKKPADCRITIKGMKGRETLSRVCRKHAEELQHWTNVAGGSPPALTKYNRSHQRFRRAAYCPSCDRMLVKELNGNKIVMVCDRCAYVKRIE